GEMLDNVSRFTMRALKGIRKKDNENVTKNMVISLSWFLSMLNRLYIDVEEELWMRFPFVCSYCNSESCVCALKRPLNRQKVIIDESKRPKTVRAFQEMFEKIYPAPKRTLEHAGVHLAEELGEFSEAFWIYRASKSKGDFEQLSLEAADFLSCFMVVFNSLNVDLASELSKYYFDNCHVCHKAPCECTYEYIKSFK
ncbi:MAG: hypothetical protein WC652_06210, partial [archaeon]